MGEPRDRGGWVLPRLACGALSTPRGLGRGFHSERNVALPPIDPRGNAEWVATKTTMKSGKCATRLLGANRQPWREPEGQHARKQSVKEEGSAKPGKIKGECVVGAVEWKREGEPGISRVKWWWHGAVAWTGCCLRPMRHELQSEGFCVTVQRFDELFGRGNLGDPWCPGQRGQVDSKYRSNFFFSSRLAMKPGRALAAERSPASEENSVTTARRSKMAFMRAPSGWAPGWAPGIVCSMYTLVRTYVEMR